jgi:hypothetical protein
MLRNTAIWTLVLVAALRAADWAPRIPRTWDDGEIGKHEIPLADPIGSPKHVSLDYRNLTVIVKESFSSYFEILPELCPFHGVASASSGATAV